MNVRKQQWAIFCMGIWLTGILCTTIVAIQNFYTIDRLIESSSNSTFHETINSLGPGESGRGREFLRYLSSELNRLYFQGWNIAQMAVGILTLSLVVRLPGARKATWGLVAMLAICLVLMAVVTPPIVSIGRSLDFVPRDPPPPDLRTFGLLHAGFSVFTFINLILGVFVTRWIQRAGEV